MTVAQWQTVQQTVPGSTYIHLFVCVNEEMSSSGDDTFSDSEASSTSCTDMSESISEGEDDDGEEVRLHRRAALRSS